MIDHNILKSLIDPKNPTKALEYLGKNMTEEDFIEWITKKIIEQKNSELIKIPVPLMYNIFMTYIQDVCKEPYGYFPMEINGSSFDIFDLTFYNYNDLTTKKWDRIYFKLLIQDIIKKNNGSAKKFDFFINLYYEKNRYNNSDPSVIDFFAPTIFVVGINEFFVVKEN